MSLVARNIPPFPDYKVPALSPELEIYLRDVGVYIERQLRQHDPNLGPDGLDPGHIHQWGQEYMLHAETHEVGGSDLVSHDNIAGFVANEHKNHAGVSVIAGTNLNGGGAITANRTINLDTNLSVTSLAAGTLTLAAGSIIDSSGAISFGNENLSTTGTLGVGTITATGATINGLLAAGAITGTSLATTGIYHPADGDEGNPSIDFHEGSGFWYDVASQSVRVSIDGSETMRFSSNGVIVAGTLAAGAITGTSFVIGGNTLTTSEWAVLDGVTSNMVLDWTSASVGTIDATNIEDKFLRNDGDDSTSGALTMAGLVVDTTTLVVNASSYEDKVGIGTATPGYPLSIAKTFTHTSGTDYILSALATYAPSADGTGNCYGFKGGVNVIGTKDLTQVIGLWPVVQTYGDGRIGSAVGVYGQIINRSDGGGVMTEAVGGLFQISNIHANATIDTVKSILIRDPFKSAGTITTNYGLYIEDQTSGGTNYAIYSVGGQSYFAGNVGIGTATPTAALQMGDDKLVAFDTNAGITASITQTQGDGALTAQVNEISTVANKDDNVTLPTAVTGIEIEIINNGANTLWIFPASGDDLGLGVNTAEELEANERVKFVAYDTTNWAKESTTEIIHAEIHDEDNADAFVVNVKTDFHSYHTNGLAAGDLADWAFDAGGAGTSFPVASIANSPGSPGDQAEITTTGAHGLAAGDIVSLTNMSAGTNTGVHIVINPNGTTFEITSGDSTDATGTVDQAATLEADAVAAGVYSFAYCISATPVGNNETFDFQLYKEATAVIGSKIRRKFGAGGDFGSMSGCGVISVGNGEKISFALSNEDTAANLIIRNLTIVLVRL